MAHLNFPASMNSALRPFWPRSMSHASSLASATRLGAMAPSNPHREGMACMTTRMYLGVEVIGTRSPPRTTWGMSAMGVSAMAASDEATTVESNNPSATAQSEVETSAASICPKACPPPGRPSATKTMPSSVEHWRTQKIASKRYLEST
jgi:hypothetical protein